MRSPSRLRARRTFGASLRAIREAKGLKQSAVAEDAGITSSHLSRLEAGKRIGVTRGLLAKLAEAMKEDPAKLYAAAGLLPPRLERELCDPELGLALEGERLPDTSRNALRRIHISRKSELVLADARVYSTPVDAESILRTLGYELKISADLDRAVEFRSRRVVALLTRQDRTRERFWCAHAAGHVVLEDEPECSCDRVFEPDEQDATAMAGFLLAPRAALSDVFHRLAGSHNVWANSAATLLADVADLLEIPLWLAARRIAEERLLSDAAQVGET
jgi:transcriptional regulator with XRE-family HTH domain